ncbi:MAG TPA: MFS transporter, partial [Luteolibacter sp.]|nr:MFS transporter [Luteolibacter sp.]
FLAGHALLSGPTWGFLATISMKHLGDAERQFPLVRVGATIGWIAGGLMTSYLLKADTSPLAGYAAGVVRLASVVLALALPHTPPLGVVRSWRSRLGLDAFVLMKQRDHLVFFVVTTLFSVPITAFYMHGPELLRVLGDPHPTGTMTVAQLLEIASMLVLGALLARHSIKAVLLWSLGLSVLRFAMSAQAGHSGLILWHVGGLALHGVCYTLYFITAQIFLDRRVDPGMRGQAQGLLTMVSGGLGPLIGAWLCGRLKLALVGADDSGWTVYWSVLAAMIAVSFVIFAICYRGSGKPAKPSDQFAGQADGGQHG